MKIPSRLTLGTAQLGMPYGVSNTTGQPSAVDAHFLLLSAVELGIASIDTAQSYGEAELRIGECIRRLRHSFITTKISCGIGTLRDAVKLSLWNLHVSRIDNLLVHDFQEVQSFGIFLSRGLEELRVEGFIRRFGFSAYGTRNTMNLPCLAEYNSIELPLNICDRRFLPYLARLKDMGFLIFARSAFLQGLLFLDETNLPPHLSFALPWIQKFQHFLTEFSVTVPELCLGFLKNILEIDSIIIGVTSTEELAADVAAFERGCDPAIIAEALRRFENIPVQVLDPRLWRNV